jgi:O-antigen/teichoic acid export membrane protein
MTFNSTAVNKAGWRFGLSQALLTRAATVADQLLVALANFWLTICIGRAFPTEALAAYGIGLSSGLMLQSLQRHTIIVPFMLAPGTRTHKRIEGMIAQHWIVLCTTLVATTFGIAVADGIDASHYARLLIGASAVCFVIYAELEFCRGVLIKRDLPMTLLASSAFYGVLCGTVGLLALAGWMDFPTLLCALGAGMVLHALGVTLRTGQVRLLSGWRFLAAHVRRYGLWSIIATGTYAGYTHLPLFILGGLLPPAHTAAYVATRSLMQPLQIIIRGLDIADKAGFSGRIGPPQRRSALFATLQISGLYASAGCVFGLIVSLFPNTLLQLAYGAKFAGERGALMAWVPVFVLLSCMMPIESLVYARRSFKGYYFARATGSVIAIALSAPLIPHFAEVGAIMASAVGSLAAGVGAVLLLARGSSK